MNRGFALAVLLCTVLAFPASLPAQAQASPATPAAPGGRALQGPAFPYVDLAVRPAANSREVVLSIQLLLLLSVLTLAPSLLILVTAFLRIAIVFDFIKRALSLQQVPPNQIMMGLALFLTLFIMWPTLSTIYEQSFKPFADGQIGLEEMYKKAESPLRVFMYRQMGGNHRRTSACS